MTRTETLLALGLAIAATVWVLGQRALRTTPDESGGELTTSSNESSAGTP